MVHVLNVLGPTVYVDYACSVFIMMTRDFTVAKSLIEVLHWLIFFEQ